MCFIYKQFYQLKYTSLSEHYQPAFDTYRNNRTAIWINSKPPFSLFMNHGVLSCYCVIFWTHTYDERLHLFFKLIRKLVISLYLTHSSLRLLRCLYSVGVMPVRFLKIRLKYSALSYPTVAAISAMFLSVLSRYPFAAAILSDTIYCIGGTFIMLLKL